MRTFSLNEANMLLPVLESLLRTGLDANQQLQDAQRELQEARQHVFLSGGGLLRVSSMLALQKRIEKASQRRQDALAEIDSMGVQIKDLEIGLLDFPCQMDDQLILLCWKLGESSIGYWHTVEDGFQGRRPIDANFAGPEVKPS
ncbi:MAG: DUF2203 domain-containing protein [Terriglobales bacterium]